MAPDRIIFENLFESEALKFIRGNLLDIGAGFSPYRSAINKRCSYYSIDIDAKKKPTVCADAHFLPFNANSFKSVLCTFLFEHLSRPWIAIKEIERILKPDGAVILSVPFLCRYHADPYDFWRFTKDSLNELLHDFKIVRIYELGRVYTTIATFLYDNSPCPKFLIALLLLFLFKAEKYLDKKVEHTLGFLVIARK